MAFEDILGQVKPTSGQRMAVAAAEDAYVLRSVKEAYDRGLAEPILVGHPEGMERAAAEAGVDLALFERLETASDEASAREAVRLVREGRAAMLMKGLLQTVTLLRAVLDKEEGLRGAGVLSHVGAIHSPILGRMLLITDGAMVPYPDLKTKVSLIQNAVAAAKGLGIHNPKVAPLAAVEVVNPDMPATVDAALLTVMNRRGQIKGCVVDGPLAMDIALSHEAARHKGVISDVAGQADILLFHNIEAANSVLKTFTCAGNSLFGGVVMGASAPIVLTSRSDSEQSKLYSIACAAAICGA